MSVSDSDLVPGRPPTKTPMTLNDQCYTGSIRGDIALGLVLGLLAWAAMVIGLRAIVMAALCQ